MDNYSSLPFFELGFEVLDGGLLTPLYLLNVASMSPVFSLISLVLSRGSCGLWAPFPVHVPSGGEVAGQLVKAPVASPPVPEGAIPSALK